MNAWISRRAIFFAASAIALGCIAIQSNTSEAHTPDTSYATVTFTPTSLRIEFAFDLETISKIEPADIDRDGSISESEFRTIESRIRSLLRREIEFEISENVTDLGEYESAVWPASESHIPVVDWNQTLVSFPFERKIAEIPESVTLTFRIFSKLGDRHKVLGIFKQPNKPTYEVVYSAFEPDFLYFTDFAPTWSSQIITFLRLGMEHIFIGYDHILFLLGLLITSKFWPLIKIVTSFTLAHTVTLCLAATQTVAVPSRLIEVCIAGTIVFVALENLIREEPVERWRLTFVFGLIHGFGFANVLSELGLPGHGLARCLLSFNVGVEIGQLIIVACIWPIWKLLARENHQRKLTQIVSIIILLCGVAWMVDRIAGTQIMPF